MPSTPFEWLSFWFGIAGLILAIAGVILSGVGLDQARRAKREARNAAISAAGAKEAANTALERASRFAGFVDLARLIENLQALQVSHAQSPSRDYLISKYRDVRRELLRARDMLEPDEAVSGKITKIVRVIGDVERILGTNQDLASQKLLKTTVLLLPEVDALISYFNSLDKTHTRREG